MRTSPAAGRLLTGLLLGLATLAPAPRAQDVQAVAANPVIHTGRYDFTTHAFVPTAAAEEGGGGDILVYDQSVVPNDGGDPPMDIVLGLLLSPGLVAMDWGVLAAEGNNAITRATLVYGTLSPDPVDLALYLQSGTMENLPGKGVRIVLEGLPGKDPEGDPAVADLYGVEVDLTAALGEPLYLPDGPIGYAYETLTPVTGPLLVAWENTGNGVINRLNQYDLAGQLIGDGKLKPTGTGINYRAVSMQLYGQPEESYDPTTAIDAMLSSKDRFDGRTESASDVDSLRLPALPGEELKLVLKVGKGSDLQPAIDVVDVASGDSLASAGDGSGKLKLDVALQGGGTYDLRVSGLAGTQGDYRLQVKTKLPKELRKPEPTATPQALGGELLSFVAQAGSTLKANVRTATKTLQFVGPPTLQGPVGAVDLAPYMVQKGTKFKLKNVPLDVDGAYRLLAGTSAAGVGQLAKGKVKPAKTSRRRLTEAEAGLYGTWLQQGFNTPKNTVRLMFDADAKGGDSRLVTVSPPVDGPITTTQRFKKWTAGPKPSALQPTRRLVSYKVKSPVLIEGSSLASTKAPSGKQLNDYVHRMGSAFTLQFLTTGALWHRDLASGPAPPDVSVAFTSSQGVAGVPDGQVALVIDCADGVVAYDIYKAPLGGDPPAFPYETHVARCTGPVGSQTTTWVDRGSVDDGVLVPATYYLRAVDAQEQRGVLGAGVDVSGT